MMCDCARRVTRAGSGCAISESRYPRNTSLTFVSVKLSNLDSRIVNKIPTAVVNEVIAYAVKPFNQKNIVLGGEPDCGLHGGIKRSARPARYSSA